jgi:L-threonylcarbamoyladenylate synthase
MYLLLLITISSILFGIYQRFIKKYIYRPHVLPSNPIVIWFCGWLIRNGFLVAFPTETVVGMGANGLDSNAVSKIYDIKQRPSNNPVILHIYGIECVFRYNLVIITSHEEKILRCLAQAFWDGPATFVMKANLDVVPSNVRAGGDFVSFRSPSHPDAKRLIKAARCPIAAPSANKYGYVSPTEVSDVFGDYKNDGRCLFILNEKTPMLDRDGIESAIFKIVGNTITILRSGRIGEREVFSALAKAGFNMDEIVITYFIRVIEEGDTSTIAEAPGQLYRHYSPNTLTFRSSVAPTFADRTTQDLSNYVIIAANDEHIAEKCLKYISLGKTITETARNLYKSMREADTLQSDGIIISIASAENNVGGLKRALEEKIDRATEKRFIQL